MIHSDRRTFRCPLGLDVGLPEQVSVTVDGARGDEADHPALPVEDRIASVGHAHALFVEAEPHHLAVTRPLLLEERLPADEPRLVGLHVRAEAGLADAEAPFASHLVAVKRQPGFRA